MNDTVEKRSKVELIKEESVYLKGQLAEELADDNDFVSDASYELLKFHGSYQGYNRDTATARKKEGLDKEWEFMVRMKCPGGRLTAKQYLGLDDICDKYANGTLRITTRETFQFHCIVKKDMKAHLAAINEQLLTTIGGCGDVVRNVMCSPAPIKNAKYERMLSDALAINDFTMPKTSAYHEIWLDGENVARTKDNKDYEPLYGQQYLTRKFKICVTVPEDNSMDALTHDLAFIMVYDGDELQGYNIYMGGGLGMTHNKPATYPRIASPIAFVGEGDLLKATAAVVKLARDHCDRGNRKHARLKYLVEEQGIEWTRKTLEDYFGDSMEDARPTEPFFVPDHMGWHEQGDGKWYLGVPISSGRIVDRDDEKVRSGLHAVISEHQLDLVLTSDQNIILCDIEDDKKQAIIEQLRSFGIKLAEDISNLHRNTMACVALPTCGKALAEAERVKLPMVASLEKVLESHGLENETMALRIAGCPNGCSRPYVGDVSIVGRMPGHYAMFIGGDFEGTRLANKILDRVPADNIKDVFDVMMQHYAKNKQDGEKYGDFVHRVGSKAVLDIIIAALGGQHKWAVAG